MLVYCLRTNWPQGLKQADYSLLYFGFCSHCFPVTPFLRGLKSLKSLDMRSRPILSKPEKYLRVKGGCVKIWLVPSAAHMTYIKESQNRVLGTTVLLTLFCNFLYSTLFGYNKKDINSVTQVKPYTFSFWTYGHTIRGFWNSKCEFLWRHLMGYIQSPNKSVYKLRVWRWLENLNHI
jgi:hypothetical protein